MKRSGIINVSYISDGYEGKADINTDRDITHDDKDQKNDKREDKKQEIETNEVERKKEKKRILKNILIISTSFFFLFTSYNSMSNLQSSLNKVDGTASLTALYVAYIFSCCFLPSWVLQVLREKKTMVLCILCYSLYMAAQFYPHIYALVPTAVVLGLAAAPLWSAKCTYLTKVSGRYGDLAVEKSEVVVTRFFGIFFLFFQATQVVGNLISSSVLSVGVENNFVSPDEDALTKCGYHFCIADENARGQKSNATEQDGEERNGPPLWQIYTMAAVYLCCSLLSALIILIFLDPLSRFPKVDGNTNDQEEKRLQLLAATFNHLRHPYQPLIVPLTIWSGIEQAFLSADFTAAYVSCGLGVHMVGYTMICYGLCDAVCSLGFSPLVKKLGRIPIFTLAFVLNVAIIIALTRWSPHPDDLVWFFVISGLWGMADAVWQTQINSLYGVIFPGQSAAAFSNYRLWESLGFAIAYICSTILCVNSKITVLIVFLASGMTGYYIIEFLEWRGGPKKDRNGVVVTIDELICGET
ncbi:Ion channel regulatory protein UNC-93 [Halocaridina rubra]|uniref:Ion channel regulatory protein UNC-93 n=1 Tax=Halocaridina rubra TaxID=373956 RepID=A0AAN8WHC9_HALRR